MHQGGTGEGLQVTDLRASYDDQLALDGVDVLVHPGSCVAVLGANGAGKTTLMNAIAGLHRPVLGQVKFEGRRIDQLGASRIARSGICYVPEGRGIFPDLTVAENLWLSVGRDPKNREVVFNRFPVLKERLHQHAGRMSGGEQQMLAMAPTLVGDFRLLLVDELSLGLAPIVVGGLFELLAEIRSRGTSILLVEQFAERALRLADYAYVIRKGRIVYEGAASALRGRDELLHSLYMGEETTTSLA